MREERNVFAKTMMTSSSRIPAELNRDIVEEIFARAPVNFIGRFLWTDKELTQRLTSQAFADRFQEVQREKPKALVCVSLSGNWFYESWSYRRQTSVRLCPMTEGLGSAFYYERGLILYPRVYSRILLLNPSTTQRILAPPLPKKVTLAFLGFDFSCGLYRLLVCCEEAEEVFYFLLTLGQRQWKLIETCGVTIRPHLPSPRMLSVSINELLYFGGDNSTLILFNFNTEKFTFIKVPIEPVFVPLWPTCVLSEFKGHLLLADPNVSFPRVLPMYPSHDFVYWTLEVVDGSEVWLQHSVDTDRFSEGLDRTPISVRFEGASPNGKLLIFSIIEIFKSLNPKVFVLYCNPDAGGAYERFEIEGLHEIDRVCAWNFTESITIMK